MKRKKPESNKAVSSVLGYTLILGIVILILSIIFIHTYSMVNQTREKVKYGSMAQGFEKIQNMINYVAYSGTSERSIRIMLNEGSISVTRGCKISISVYNTTSTVPVYNYSGYSGAVVYSYGDYKIAFENGGVWLSSHGMPSIVSSPRIFLYKKIINNQTVFFMALTFINGSGSIGGNSFAQILVRFNSSSVKIFGPGYIRLKIVSEFARAWYNYFNCLKNNQKNVASMQTELNGSNVYVTIHFSEMILTSYKLNVSVG
jgi:hypothetical protein